jgi:hypothetical protein
MKKIKYKFLSAEINNGTIEEPDIEYVFLNKFASYSEANEEIAKREAYNGEYEIYDDGQPEPVVEPSAQEDTDAMLIDHELRLTMLELGLTE